jgi:hypothetical protein
LHVFEPGDDSVLEIVESDGAGGTADDEIVALDLQDVNRVALFLVVARLAPGVNQIHRLIDKFAVPLCFAVLLAWNSFP